MPFQRQRQQAPFCAGFAMRESVAADHDCYETCNFRDRPGKKALDRVKAGIEG